MTKFDEVIRTALLGFDPEVSSQTETQGYFALSLSQFHGKLGWVTWVIMLVQSGMFVGGIWCAVHLFTATETLFAVKWGISGAVLLIGAIVLKTSLMPQMQADRIIREVRRTQLLIVARK